MELKEERVKSRDALEERLPAEVREALDMLTALLFRIKDFTRKSFSDYLTYFAFFLAGVGFYGFIAFWMQYQILWYSIFGGG